MPGVLDNAIRSVDKGVEIVAPTHFGDLHPNVSLVSIP
jgi:hypothetical protein